MLLRREPARALPVPFCRYIFLVVPATSERPLVCAGAHRQVGLYIDHRVVDQLLVDLGSDLGGSTSYVPTSAPDLSNIVKLTMALSRSGCR